MLGAGEMALEDGAVTMPPVTCSKCDAACVAVGEPPCNLTMAVTCLTHFACTPAHTPHPCVNIMVAGPRDGPAALSRLKCSVLVDHGGIKDGAQVAGFGGAWDSPTSSISVR
jgi:hypothetical protein